MRSSKVAALLCGLAPNGVFGAIKMLNYTTAQLPGISTRCYGILTQEVDCDPTLLEVNKLGISDEIYHPDEVLKAVCTTTCTDSLNTWVRRVGQTCGTEWIQLAGGNGLSPLLYSQTYSETYNYTCLKNSAGAFCNAVARSAAQIDPTHQKQTATPAATWQCDRCYLSLKATQLQMPMASNTAVQYFLGNLTSSCSVTMALTSPAALTLLKKGTATTTGTSTAPTASCTGTMYTIASGNTCQSISTSQQISTSNLLRANNLQSFCNNFPTSGKLCIPTAMKCTPHTVLANQTCGSIAASLKVSRVRFVSWNPDLGSDCQNIANFVGYVICKSNPGGGWVDPTPFLPPTTTTTTTIDTRPWVSMSARTTEITLTHKPSFTTNITDQRPTAMPVANRTRQDCFSYLDPPIKLPLRFVNGVAQNRTYSSTCAAVAAGYGVTVAQLKEWNPSLGPVNSTASCSLNPAFRYCVRDIEQRVNATSACTRYELAKPGMTCESFAGRWGLDFQGEFRAWNPMVESDCKGFQTGKDYCVDVWGYRQPGQATACNKWVINNATNFYDKPCEIIETKFGLNHNRFVAWNPAVLSNCTEIYARYEYCVSIPGFVPTYTTVSSQVESTATSSSRVSTSSKVTTTSGATTTSRVSSTSRASTTSRTSTGKGNKKREPQVTIARS